MARPKQSLLDKACKQFGKEYISEIQSMDSHELEQLITKASRETLETKSELLSNENYVKVVQDKTYFESGFKEIKKLNNLKIKLAHSILNDRGVA